MTAFSRPTDRRRTLFLAAASLGLTATLALAFAGCSDPAPIIPRGAWAVSWIKPANCKIFDHNSAIGEVDADSRTKLFEDGELLATDDSASGVDVSCAVIATDSGFQVEGYESARELLLNILVNDLPADATKDKPAKGTVAYKSADTANIFNSANCNFYFIPGTGQGVKDGQVFLTFECDDIAYESDNICTIKPGYVALENCRSKGDEE